MTCNEPDCLIPSAFVGGDTEGNPHQDWANTHTESGLMKAAGVWGGGVQEIARMIPGFHLDTAALRARVVSEQPWGFEREHKGSTDLTGNTGEISHTHSINSDVLRCLGAPLLKVNFCVSRVSRDISSIVLHLNWSRDTDCHWHLFWTFFICTEEKKTVCPANLSLRCS